MTNDAPIRAREELVFAIDLTTGEMARAALDVEAAAETKGDVASQPLPEPPPHDVRHVALLLDDREEPLVLPIAPTRDVVLLDALARLLRIAVLAGERVPAVAIEYGEELERRLAFERKLPDWVYEGVEPDVAAELPVEVRRVLGPKTNR